MMGIMSDETKARTAKTLDALCVGLNLAAVADPKCAIAATVLRAYGMRAIEAGYQHLGWTDEVTVNADGDVTGEIIG